VGRDVPTPPAEAATPVGPRGCSEAGAVPL